MSEQTNFGGTFTLPKTSIPLKRMGYGAMQLARAIALVQFGILSIITMHHYLFSTTLFLSS